MPPADAPMATIGKVLRAASLEGSEGCLSAGLAGFAFDLGTEPPEERLAI